MRHFIYIVLLFCSLDSIAQYDWDSKNWNKKSLGIACGLGGQMTKPVLRMSKLLTERNYEEIKQTLNSKLTPDQFIATFVLEKLSDKGELELSDTELKRIQEIKSSKQKVAICSGCTYWDELPLSDLFDTKNKQIISASADYWFDRYYKKEGK